MHRRRGRGPFAKANLGPQSFDIVGKCAVKFRFTTGPTLKVTFYCAEVLSYPYVLGLPTQQRAGAVFDFHTGTVTFKELNFSMSLDHGGGLTRPHRRGFVHLENSPANSEDDSDASRDGENMNVEFAKLRDFEHDLAVRQGLRVLLRGLERDLAVRQELRGCRSSL